MATEPIDFRCGIDGLARTSKQALKADPFCGALLVFRNKRSTAIKILAYDGVGFWLCQKRLSQGRFQWWPQAAAGACGLEAHQLQLLLAGGNPAAAPGLPVWRPVRAAM